MAERSEANLLVIQILIFFEAKIRFALLASLTHRGTRGAWSAFFSVFASHFHISQQIFKNLQK
jgi:hypothetical protein